MASHCHKQVDALLWLLINEWVMRWMWYCLDCRNSMARSHLGDKWEHWKDCHCMIWQTPSQNLLAHSCPVETESEMELELSEADPYWGSMQCVIFRCTYNPQCIKLQDWVEVHTLIDPPLPCWWSGVVRIEHIVFWPALMVNNHKVGQLLNW